jgi:hypothetical protein
MVLRSVATVLVWMRTAAMTALATVVPAVAEQATLVLTVAEQATVVVCIRGGWTP